MNSIQIFENIEMNIIFTCIHYKVFSGYNFMILKDMLQSSTTDLQINNKIRSITLLTEIRLYAVILKSKKPFAVKIRIWITKFLIITLFGSD